MSSTSVTYTNRVVAAILSSNCNTDKYKKGNMMISTGIKGDENCGKKTTF
jgi:hypothetical protein